LLGEMRVIRQPLPQCPKVNIVFLLGLASHRDVVDKRNDAFQTLRDGVDKSLDGRVLQSRKAS
jgi:hypothetical protein